MLCFRTVPVVKIVMDKKGDHQKIPSIIFCLTVLKNSVGGSFSVSVSSGTEKIWIKRGGIMIFRRKKLVSLGQNSRRGIF